MVENTAGAEGAKTYTKHLFHKRYSNYPQDIQRELQQDNYQQWSNWEEPSKRSLQKQPRKEPTKHEMGRAILEPTRKVMKGPIEERAYQFITATRTNFHHPPSSQHSTPPSLETTSNNWKRKSVAQMTRSTQSKKRPESGSIPNKYSMKPRRLPHQSRRTTTATAMMTQQLAKLKD